MIVTDRTRDVSQSECLAWASYAFWTLACAWPAWTVPGYVHAVLAGVYGLLAWALRSPLGAGAAGACLGSLALRTACADHGPGVALVGAVVATLAALLVFALSHHGTCHVDADGRMEARPLCLHLALCTGVAAVWTVPLAGSLAWSLRA